MSDAPQMDELEQDVRALAEKYGERVVFVFLAQPLDEQRVSSGPVTLIGSHRDAAALFADPSAVAKLNRMIQDGVEATAIPKGVASA